MELIRKLGTRIDRNGFLVSYGEFLCSFDNKIVERPLSDGKKCKSCGCQQGNKIHNESRIKLYAVWSEIKQRILNPKNKFYKDYGGRGITICPEWTNDYIKFRDWALENGYKEGLQIDRRNTNGNYEPNNCRWITCEKNNQNKVNMKIKSIEQANEIRELDATGKYTQKELAIKYRISESYIRQLVRNERWKST